MTQSPVVGNDIVDLGEPRTEGKHSDPRFVARVLGENERAVLTRAEDPAVALWAFWAAKEAAYKVASKLRGAPPVFIHAAFCVTWTEVGPARWEGHVAYEELDIPVVAVRSGTMIHAVAVSGADIRSALPGAELLDAPAEAWGARLAELLPSFTEREADAVHSLPSAAVRVRARAALAEMLAAGEADVEIVCDPGVTGRRPPRVHLRGRPAPADVSLSHHGRWVAWAVLPQNPLGR
ncbi:MAG TPA: 4'-phosphopantetheinyl transferase superfamily protein [Longimicrobiales bacterium]|nr:4'-phosphopantetheinyl transferase superfamily protein [Longimicrobiales bacterium]